jgi:very-short-patch-repair endonuclease
VERSRPQAIVVHRRSNLARRELTHERAIPVTRPAVAIVDTARSLSEKDLERMINEADQEHVIHFDVILREIERMPHRWGIGVVKGLVLRHTFRLTRSELERLFLAIVRRAGLPVPKTRAIIEGFEVDFWFPTLGLLVEADSLTYHRTPGKQLQDRLRDQAHFAADLVPLRFTHWQIARQPRYVEHRLRQVAAQIAKRQLAAA